MATEKIKYPRTYHLPGSGSIMCMVDDRLSVLDIWNKNGIYTINVNQFQKLF